MFPQSYSQRVNKTDDEANIWYDEPTYPGFYFYAIIVPILTFLGATFNIFNIIIYSRPTMTCSTYTYLLALSCCDCISCVLIFTSGLARSIFYGNFYLFVFDTFIHLPVGSILSAMANFILVSLAIDRVLYLKNTKPRGAPQFCRHVVARQTIGISAFISLLLNIPYFFIYHIDDEYEIETTEFFVSFYYQVHNWLRFILAGVLPAIFLMIGNGIMIYILRRYSKSKKSSSEMEKNSMHMERRVTITLIIVVFLFVIGEIPSYFASRQSAITLLYNGDITQTNNKKLETFRIIATILNTCHVSLNIIIYATTNPAYLTELFKLLQTIFCIEVVKNSIANQIGDKCQTENIPSHNQCII